MSVITEFEVENVKRIKAVRIHPNSGAVLVGGKNAQGKTSLLDAIGYTFGGTRGIPGKPVREGEDRAFSKATLSNGMTVERKYKENGTSTLVVRDADGLKIASPQSVLEKLWSDIACDPLKFSRSKPKERIAVLREVSGLDFTGVDAKRDELYEDRKAVNRQLRDLEGKIREMPLHENAPAKLVTAEDVQAEMSAAMAEVQKVAAIRKSHEDRKTVSLELECQIDAAMAKLVELRREMKELNNRKEKALEEEAEAAALCENLVDPDVSAVAAKLDGINELNDKVRANEERLKAKGQASVLRDQTEEISKSIEDIDGQKKKDLAGAKLPVDGLGFSADDVTINDLPWEQASQAEQLRVSVAMALAMHPEIKVLLIRDASLLDENSLALVAEMAEAEEAQVFLEVVRTADVHVVIEDGEVAS